MCSATNATVWTVSLVAATQLREIFSGVDLGPRDASSAKVVTQKFHVYHFFLIRGPQRYVFDLEIFSNLWSRCCV